MKRLLLAVLITLSALSAFGQAKDESVNQRFFDARIREFVYRLNLTDQQKEQFIPIYKRYNDEMRAAVGDRVKKQNRPETSEEAAAIAKTRIERQQKAQAVRLKYVDEFAKVLDPSQLSSLYDVESQIQKKLMDRKQGRRPDAKHGRRPISSEKKSR